MISRRQLLAALPLAAVGACSRNLREPGAVRVTLAGQALMKHSLCAEPYPGFAELLVELRSGDVVLTDLEVAIQTPESGAPTRDTEFFHATSPTVLACLRAMGFNLLALSNNHAWDLGTAGILATRKAVLEYGFAAAGTGASLAEASAPAIIDLHGFRVALVAMATEKIRDGAAATATRPGVNELRLLDGAPHPEDAARMLGQLRIARRQAELVIAYHHNHDWGENMAVTRPWAMTWAAACADAGADLYLSHGAPLLHGIGRHRDGVLFYGLGSLVFHSITDIGHYPPEVWETAIAHCDYQGSRLRSVELVPVVLNEVGDDPARQNETRGRPRIAAGSDAARILARLQARSAPLGVRLRVAGDRARADFS